LTSEKENISTIIGEKTKISHTSILSNRGVLLVLSSDYLGKTFILDKKESIIGRDSNCCFTIEDQLISKKHCKISCKDNKFILEDLGSRNKTFVNEKEIKKPIHLVYGDRIIIGKTIIRFYLEERLEVKRK